MYRLRWSACTPWHRVSRSVDRSKDTVIGMQLRPYQREAVTDLRHAFMLGHKRVLFYLPTGGGKTVVFSEIAKGATLIGRRVLILVHRRELLHQAVASLRRLGIQPREIAGHQGYIQDCPVHVACVHTIVNRMKFLDANTFDLIVIDEAHHATANAWARTTEHFSGAKVLGVTATPCRGDGRGLREQFELMIRGPEPQWLTDQGFLAKTRVFAPPVGFNPSLIKRRMGDFDREGSEQQLISAVVLGDVIEHYQTRLEGGTAIAFCVSIKHALAVANQFNAAGIRAESIDGTMKQEVRDSLLRQLATGEIKVLTSCDLIGEGVDVPSVSGCIMLRPTQSLGLFLQMVGRCLRPSPDKSYAVILDHVGNYERHGHHLDDRSWSLDGAEGGKTGRKRAAEQAASVWVCPNCFATNRSTDNWCIDCGQVKPDGRGAVAQLSGELAEIDSDRRARLRSAQQRLERKNRRREQGTARSLQELCELGRQRGMKYPYAWAKKVLAGRRNKREA